MGSETTISPRDQAPAWSRHRRRGSCLFLSGLRGQSLANRRVPKPELGHEGNMVKSGTLYSSVYVLFITLSQRRWKSEENAPVGVLFERPQHPYITQVFKVDAENDGVLTVTEVKNPSLYIWNATSEIDKDTKQPVFDAPGGALASQLRTLISSNGFVPGNQHQFFYQGSGGFSPRDVIIHDNFGFKADVGGDPDLKQKYLTSDREIPKADDQRNSDKSPPKIEFFLRAKPN